MQLEFMGLVNQKRPFEIDGKETVIQAHSEAETTVQLGRQCSPHQDLFFQDGQTCRGGAFLTLSGMHWGEAFTLVILKDSLAAISAARGLTL